METIRTYLESMFSALPNTSEVRRAKKELEQMMEDKFQELISAGKSENEAIGTVISEFGNLDELASTLGIDHVLHEQTEPAGNVLSLDEVQDFLEDSARASLMHGLIAFLGIICASGLILAGGFEELVGSTGSYRFVIQGFIFLFGCIAVIIGLAVYSGSMMEKWKYIKKNKVRINYSTAEYIQSLRDNRRPTYALLRTIGVICCALCFVPLVMMGLMGFSDFFLCLGLILLLLLVGIGVLILTTIDGREKSCRKLLRLNSASTIGGNYVPSQDEVRYQGGTMARLMSLYWPTITAIYLVYSFLTFRWGSSWLIWPIAGVINRFIRTVWNLPDEDKDED